MLWLLYNKYNARNDLRIKGTTMTANAFGAFLKKLRMQRGITLREFCETNKLDAGNYSRLERGLYTAPQSEENIAKYARAHGLKEGSEEWVELFDLAYASKGEIPKDLLSDQELVQKLPALFRTLRGNPVSPEDLDRLVDDMRRG